MEELNYKICLFSKKSYRNVISFNTIVDYVFKISCWKTHINHELIPSDNSREPLLDIVLGTSLQFAQSKKTELLMISFVRKTWNKFFLASLLHFSIQNLLLKNLCWHKTEYLIEFSGTYTRNCSWDFIKFFYQPRIKSG